MGSAISEVFPFAVGVAISPIPIIAVILVLFSARARVNGPAFLLGWVVGVAVVSVAVYYLADAGDVATDSDASDTSFWIKLLLGVVLVLLAVRRWRGRPAPGEPAPQPKWMGAIDSLTPLKAVGLALLLSAVNPKNLALSLAAGASLAQAGASGGEAVVGLVLFIVVAASTIGGPVAIYLFGGDPAARMLESWKEWLAAHNAAVMAVLLLVFGVDLFSQGLRGLSA
jgi:threonine/homoserine/homoserine lactone efflux protein